MKRTLLLGLALSIGTTAMGPFTLSYADPLTPTPTARPPLLASPSPAPLAEAIPFMPPTPSPVARSPLKAGLDALSNRDGAEAIAVRDSMPQGLDRHMLTWSIARSGLPDVSSSEITNALKELKGWPGLSVFRSNAERALYRENPPASAVLAAFGKAKPETPEGTIILARALIAQGEQAKAAHLLKPFWFESVLDTSLEDRILNEFGALFSATDHKRRMDFLMYRGNRTQAKRFATLAGAQSLFAAWDAVATRSPKAAGLIKAVDRQWSADPALLFIKIEFERHQDNYEAAARLLAQAPKDPARLVAPSEWWSEQRIVGRGLADDGKFRLAYHVVSNNSATAPVDVLDAEFHAGWFALRGLNDPKTAAVHFRRILATSSRPLSASRGYYWLARADEAEHNAAAARENFTKAANYPGTFYGQLAAARLNRNRLDIIYPTPTTDDRQTFANREAVEAIDRYETAGHGWRATALYHALAEQLQSPGELALLAAKAERAGNNQLSLQIGKTAYGRGINVPALAFPIGVIPASANIAGSGKALAYAIARQESSFNPAAVSAANAKGLLQLMPATAKAVARRHGMSYFPEKLTQDAGYNATLGAHYLGEQIDKFGGSYILTFIAYNAGPNRVPDWIARYGDPRGKPLDDVVDWIERIPFPETRGYVQRVMENYEIYKTRLGQKPDIEHDLRFGR
ncbi:lytic transglycosylase domain-containing protein [Allorhizobium terrae]|uniref:Lytic transglycosylase domain-containing protein n=1 Tax=Allorhizobium terrae TaxID=1848972 RepID=A0A4S4A2N1_9HYPH|nr:lytic transglycosylase domain-containing protein [Allorhizobium terrae]THF52500.1 lytic transglycosylase domain-containing protein [Allorhizobium terrae]